MVLTRSRTGSNWLISMLDSHPAIHAEYEIFARLKGKRYQNVLARFFSRQPRGIRAAGFKIFYYHPLDDDGRDVWQALQGIEDLSVIHLKRRNILRTVVSRSIADKQNRWALQQGGEPSCLEERCVELEVDELRTCFEQTRQWEREFEHAFDHRDLMSVYYEDLVAQPEHEYGRILAALDLDFVTPKTHLRQQNPESLFLLIRNYDRLKTAFRGTQWEPFFED